MTPETWSLYTAIFLWGALAGLSVDKGVRYLIEKHAERKFLREHPEYRRDFLR